MKAWRGDHSPLSDFVGMQSVSNPSDLYAEPCSGCASRAVDSGSAASVELGPLHPVRQNSRNTGLLEP